MRAATSTVLFLAVVLGADAARGAVRGNVSPDLHPKSHDKFFDKDYPDDLRPGVKDHFNSPFPIVQESKDYDKDYVKDENADGGEWKAQADYDHLRTKLSNLNSDAKHLGEKEAQKEKDLKEAEEAVKKANEKAQAAKDAADAAEKDAAARKATLEEHEEHGKANGTGNATDGAADAGSEGGNGTNGSSGEVDKAEMDLDDCMKQLAEANAKLEKLIEEKKKREAEHATRLAEEANATAANASAANSEADLAAKLRAAEEAHQTSLKSIDEEKADLEKLQKDLEAKAKTLRKYREQQLGEAGNLYHDSDAKKSGAATSMLSILVGLFVAGSCI